MKITKEEVLKLANDIKIDIPDSDLDAIIESIEDISRNLEELVKFEVEAEPKMMEATITNQFNDDYSKEVDTKELMEAMNNYDGTYIKIGKVIDSE